MAYSFKETTLLSGLVGLPHKPSEGSSFHSTQPYSHPDNDASLWGWGVHIGNDYIRRGLSRKSDQEAHQQHRAFGHHVGPDVLSFTNIRSHRSSPLWQHHSGVLPQQIVGGTISMTLCHLELSLWEFCIVHSIQPVALHLLGEQNIMSDPMSRGCSSFHKMEINWTIK